MSFLCCDCCLNILGFKKTKKSEGKSYVPEQLQDLDEEQLMAHNINKEAKRLPSEYFHQQDDVKDHLKSMNVQLQLNKNNYLKEDQTKSQGSSKDQNNKSQSEKDYSQNQHEQVYQTPSEQSLKPNFAKFSINLDPYDKYYKFLHQKTQNLERYFSFEGKQIDMGESKSKLKATKIDANKFEIQFVLPCSYSFYTMLMKDSNIGNKKYLSQFQRSQVLEAFKPNFSKNILRMRRYSMLQPREFIYLKYSNGSYKQNWQICINQPQQDLLSQQSSDHKRCDLFSISNFKEIGQRLYVRQYIQIDLKASNMNSNIWGKLMHEAKEYFQKLYAHVQNYYQKELV